MADNKSSIEGKKSKGSSTEDVTVAERDLAQQVQIEFHKGNYGSTVPLLNRLCSSRSSDVKVLMNKCVVEYYKSSLKKTEAFRKNLASISTKAKINLEGGDPFEAEHSVIVLNHAIVLFHLRQFQPAIAILERLKNKLDILEESVGIEVCLLLAECYLGMLLPSKVRKVIVDTEATFLPEPLPSPKQLQDKDSKSPEKVISQNETCRSNSNSSLNSINSNNNGTTNASNDEVKITANQELRNRLQLLRIRVSIMLRSIKAGKEEIETYSQSNSNESQTSLTLINLKSQLEYLEGNYTKSIKILNQCGAIPPPSPTCGPKLDIVYYNNQGVIHFGLGKPTLACLYLQKVLEELQTERKSFDEAQPGDPLSNRTIYQVGCIVGPELCYNLGVTLLHMNKPCRAFDFLLDAQQAYPQNPRLWLRLAECCIFAHKKRLKEDASLHNMKADIGAEPIGSKINISSLINNHDNSLPEQLIVNDAAFPEPNLKYARMCLVNALAMLPEISSTTATSDEHDISSAVPELHSVNPSTPIKGSEVLTIKASCLACSSYVALCVTDYIGALKHAQTLLSLPTNILPAHKILGNLYAGEALICLGKINEALAHLDPRIISDISLSPTLAEVGQVPTYVHNNQGWFSGMTASAEQVMRYNLSVAYTLRGELEKAQGLIKELWNDSDSMPAHIVMLGMYIQLRLGNFEMMRNIVQSRILQT